MFKIMGYTVSNMQMIGFVILIFRVLPKLLRSLFGPPPKPMPPGGHVVAVHNKEEWAAQLAKNKESGRLMVVDFTATWCGPCQRIAPRFAAMSEGYAKETWVKVDVDEAKEVSQECGIRCMPTFQFYKGGVKVDEMQGADPAQLESKTKEHGGEQHHVPAPKPGAAAGGEGANK